jgi:hypothetical protein
MCRRHDNEPGDTRHDDAGEPDGRTSDTWRFDAVTARLLTGNSLRMSSRCSLALIQISISMGC